MKIFAIWGLALLTCVGIVKFTKIGPTILTISAEQGWGVHVGDALVLIPLTVAVLLTMRTTVNR